MLLLYVQEPDLEVLANMLEAIQDTVRLVGPALMTLEQLGQAFERFQSVLDDSAKRRRERVDITTGEDFDDEEAEALEVSPAVVDVRNPLHPDLKSAALVQLWLGTYAQHAGSELSLDTFSRLGACADVARQSQHGL